MGRLRRGSIDDVRVNVTRGTGVQACGAEMVGFLACIEANGGNERECGRAREALSVCMEAAARQANRTRHKAPINFHLKQVRPHSTIPRHALAPRTHPLALSRPLSFCAT